MTTEPIRYSPDPIPPEQLRAPPLPTGFVQTTTAWQSIPTFIRFTVWLCAILTVIGLAIWPILFIALLVV